MDLVDFSSRQDGLDPVDSTSCELYFMILPGHRPLR